MPYKANPTFKNLVEELVSKIPKGRVMTYGQIAALCGSPRSARIVGSIAHFGDQTLPWQRVVNKNGRLASGFPGGRHGQMEILKKENIKVNKDYHINIKELLWWP